MEREKGPVEWEKIAHRMLLIDGNGRHGDVFVEGCQSRERDRHLLKKDAWETERDLLRCAWGDESSCQLFEGLDIPKVTVDLNENELHRFICLNAWSLVIGLCGKD